MFEELPTRTTGASRAPEWHRATRMPEGCSYDQQCRYLCECSKCCRRGLPVLLAPRNGIEWQGHLIALFSLAWLYSSIRAAIRAYRECRTDTMSPVARSNRLRKCARPSRMFPESARIHALRGAIHAIMKIAARFGDSEHRKGLRLLAEYYAGDVRISVRELDSLRTGMDEEVLAQPTSASRAQEWHRAARTPDSAPLRWLANILP